MDYEKLLFELNPLFKCDASNPDCINYSNHQLVDHLLHQLDQLALSLRIPNNRDILRASSAFSKLINCCSYITNTEVQSAIIRCLANSVVDNDENRLVVVEGSWSEKFHKTLHKNIKSLGLPYTEDEFEIGKRSVIFIRNLYLEEIPIEICYEFLSVFKSVFCKLSNAHNSIMETDTGFYLLVLEFYSDIVKIIKNENKNISKTFKDYEINDILELVDLVEHFSTLVSGISDQFKEKEGMSAEKETRVTGDEEEEDEDEDDDYEEPEELTILLLSSQLLESYVSIIPMNSRNSDVIQLRALFDGLFEALKFLESIPQFPSKLIELRRISYIINVLSSNSADFFKDFAFFHNILFSSTIDNILYNYSYSSLFFCLSNCISSSKDVTTCLKENNNTETPAQYYHFILKIFTEKILNTDPWTYQSFLDYFRKLVTIVHYPEEKSDLSMIWVIMLKIQPSLQIINGLSTYYNKLLEKLIAVLPGKLLSDSAIPINELIFKNDQQSSGELRIIGCLLLAKLYNYLSQESLFELINFCLAVKPDENGHYDEQYLFQLFKSFGVFLQNINLDMEHKHLFKALFDELVPFIEYVKVNIIDGNIETSASLAIKNNCMYLCGVLINKYSNIINELYGLDNIEAERLTYIKDIIKSM